MMKTPKVRAPKLGPLPPTTASAAPDGSNYGSRRQFSLSGVSTGSMGLMNPNLLKRNNPQPTRLFTGGST